MSFLSAYFYDTCMSSAEDACLKQWRAELLSTLSGNILEIGAGTGANLAHYPETSSLTLSEPDANMRAQLVSKIEELQSRKRTLKQPPLSIQLSNNGAEQIDAPDDHFDYIVSALVCCSVAVLDAALEEMMRALKPGGQLVFIEHVGAEHNSARRHWQNRINPFWRKLAGNCHLNRDTEQAIKNAGFEITHIQRESMRKAMPLVRPCIRGFAKKPDHYSPRE